MAGEKAIPSVYCLIDRTLGIVTSNNVLSAPGKLHASQHCMKSLVCAAKLELHIQTSCLGMYIILQILFQLPSSSKWKKKIFV